MSKIEKALSKARDERRSLQVVPVPGAAENRATGTALVAERAAHPETISRMAASESRLLSPDDLSARRIIHKHHVGDVAVQVFRELRTQIVQHSNGKNRVILVSGVTKGNGSSFVAQNLGAAFALDAVRTALIIDCNLKDPSVHRLISKSPARGLTDYLENPNIDIAEIIHPVGMPRFRVIPAGGKAEAQAEHFSSTKMKLLMDSVRQRYTERFIILDGPPMTEIADIRILSEFADYVLVVARYGRTTHSQIEKCLSAIGNEKLLGIVFNDEPRMPWLR